MSLAWALASVCCLSAAGMSAAESLRGGGTREGTWDYCACVPGVRMGRRWMRGGKAASKEGGREGGC